MPLQQRGSQVVPRKLCNCPELREIEGYWALIKKATEATCKDILDFRCKWWTARRKTANCTGDRRNERALSVQGSSRQELCTKAAKDTERWLDCVEMIMLYS
ncbi:unnamed protein product [Ceratitis capitata]|uniref:(Mediterranean fruit fly) hypothetical protein n=1 Tax=Ceratitis capitata TaxID=7213 RepID=A0A811V3V3_CERCA|nr:unnamed protein product [Ceratitis capitata]